MDIIVRINLRLIIRLVLLSRSFGSCTQDSRVHEIASLQRRLRGVLADLNALLNQFLGDGLLGGLTGLLKLSLASAPEVEELEEHGAALLGVESVVEEVEAVADKGVAPVLGGEAVGEAVVLVGIVLYSWLSRMASVTGFAVLVRLGGLGESALRAVGSWSNSLGAFRDR